MKRRILGICLLAMLAQTAHAAVRFSYNADTVSDSITGLMWQRQDDDETRTWKDALAYCENLTLAGYSNWRLPDIKELRAIVDNTTYSPAINTTVFPNTTSSGYWSSSSYAGDTSRAWSVSFSSGGVYDRGKANSGYVRCVR